MERRYTNTHGVTMFPIVAGNTEILKRNQLQDFLQENSIERVIDNAIVCEDLVVSWSAAEPLTSVHIFRFKPTTVSVDCNDPNIMLMMIYAIILTIFAYTALKKFI